MLAFRRLCWRRCLSRCLLCHISDNPTADNPLPNSAARERQNAPIFAVYRPTATIFSKKMYKI